MCSLDGLLFWLKSVLGLKGKSSVGFFFIGPFLKVLEHGLRTLQECRCQQYIQNVYTQISNLKM